VWLAAGLAFLLPCLIFGVVSVSGGRLDFSKLYPAVTGISTIGLYLSYGIPIWLKVRAALRGVWGEASEGPWRLGGWSRWVNYISIGWIGLITVLFVLPPNELTGVIFAGAVLGLTALYYAQARGRFKGPTAQGRSTEELLRIEAEFNR
jgi:hypothetical protein